MLHIQSALALLQFAQEDRSVQSRLSYLYDSRAIIWVWLREPTSAAARESRLALSYVLGSLSLFFLLCCLSSVARSVLFNSMFAFLFRLQCHLQVTLRAWWVPYPRRPKLHSENTMVPYHLGLRWEHGLDYLEILVHKFFTTWLLLFNKYKCVDGMMYKCIDTYIHTDTASVQHVKVGLAQARPNYIFFLHLWCNVSSFLDYFRG